jgi:hypothetical protein
MESGLWQAVIAENMSDQRPKRESMTIEHSIVANMSKDQIVTKQK